MRRNDLNITHGIRHYENLDKIFLTFSPGACSSDNAHFCFKKNEMRTLWNYAVTVSAGKTINSWIFNYSSVSNR